MSLVPHPTFDQFVESLVINGESSGWTSQNASGAYGRFQIMARNWMSWSRVALDTSAHPWIRLQFRLGRKPVAAKDLPGAHWWPKPTVRNQTDTARWRLAQSWAAHNGDARYVAAMWHSGGGGDPSTWSVRTLKYVNRVCGPLGYAPLPVP